MKTYMASASTIERKWYVVDAADYTLGRLASQVAAVLRGKNKPTYTPFLDCGDNVIVINADKVKFTGKKLDQKVYYSHSDYVLNHPERNGCGWIGLSMIIGSTNERIYKRGLLSLNHRKGQA